MAYLETCLCYNLARVILCPRFCLFLCNPPHKTTLDWWLTPNSHNVHLLTMNWRFQSQNDCKGKTLGWYRLDLITFDPNLTLYDTIGVVSNCLRMTNWCDNQVSKTLWRCLGYPIVQFAHFWHNRGCVNLWQIETLVC